MLNISKQVYVAWSTITHTLPDAVLAPLGNAVNEKNRVKKLTDRYSNTKEIDNIPLPGFTVQAVTPGWGSSETTWLIIDPRGFIVNISSANMVNLITVTGITEGLIQEKCVWARNDNETKLSLIPVNAPSYTQAVANTELIDNKVDKAALNIGDTVILQNGITGRYMGTQSLYGPMDYRYSTKSKHEGRVTTYCRRQIVEIHPKLFYYGANLKILKVTVPAPKILTREDAVDYMNAQIAGGGYFTSNERDNGTSTYSRNLIQLVSVHAVPKPTVNFVEITKNEAINLYKECIRDGEKYRLLIEDRAGVKYIIDVPYRTYGNPSDEFHTEPCTNVADGITSLEMVRGKHSFNNYGIKKRKLDEFVKFYKIVKNVKSANYV